MGARSNELAKYTAIASTDRISLEEQSNIFGLATNSLVALTTTLNSFGLDDCYPYIAEEP